MWWIKHSIFWSLRNQNFRNICMNWGCLDCIFLIQRLKVGRYLTVLVRLSTRKIMTHNFWILIDDTYPHSRESWYNDSRLFSVSLIRIFVESKLIIQIFFFPCLGLILGFLGFLKSVIEQMIPNSSQFAWNWASKF